MTDPIITPKAGKGITELTGDVTAGPGSGAVAAEVVGATGGLFTVRKSATGDTQIVIKGKNGEDSIIGVDGNNGSFYFQNNGYSMMSMWADGGGVRLGAVPFLGESQPFRTRADIACGTQGVDASAIFVAESTTQGALLPRMTTTEKNAITSPTEGLLVYDLTLHALCVYNGSAWKTITAV